MLDIKRKAVSGILLTLLLMSFLTPLFNIQPANSLDVGPLDILEPTNGSIITGPVTITFSILNTGEEIIEFLQMGFDEYIALEIHYQCTGGGISGWGIDLWSTYYAYHGGLILQPGEKYTRTVLFDPSEWDAPDDTIGDGPYGQAIIKLVHYIEMPDGHMGYGEFGFIEAKVTLIALTRIVELQLYAGWNLIGFPVVPEDPSIEVVLGDILDKVESVWAFDGETKTWSSYSPGAPSDLTEMVEGKGYWIKVNTDSILTIYGDSD